MPSGPPSGRFYFSRVLEGERIVVRLYVYPDNGEPVSVPVPLGLIPPTIRHLAEIQCDLAGLDKL